MIDLTPYFVRERMVTLAPASRDALVLQLIDVCLGEQAQGEPDTIARRREILRAIKDQPLGAGFALSHARISAGGEIRFSIGLLREPHTFGHAANVHTIFCALIPENRSREYLSFLARLSRLLMMPHAAEVFRGGNPDRILELVRTFQT